MDKRVKKIKDPIYGYIEVPVSYITGIIDTAPFQRLRRVIQTSYAPLYPGTVHNRFTHSIGVYHLGVIATNSISNCLKHIKNISVDVDRLVSVFRLSCLLHDVGHAPFSHTGEKYYLGVNNSYDELHKRLADLIGSDEIIKDSSKNPGKKAAPHEIMSAIIGLSNYSDIIGDLDDRDFFSRCITGYEYSASDIDSQVKNCFIGLLNSKVIDVDKLDYLLRDAYFSGHGTVNIDYQRLLSSITIVEIHIGKIETAFLKQAVSVIENVVYAHDNERKWIQNHPTVLYESYIVTHMINKINRELNQSGKKLFSEESLTEKGQDFSDIHVSLLSDDDIIFIAKNKLLDDPLIKEYFNRNSRRHPIWKSEAEYKSYLIDMIRGGSLLDDFVNAIELTSTYISKNTENGIITKNTIDTIHKEINEIENSALDEDDILVQKEEKAIILKVLNALSDYADSKGLEFNFVMLTAMEFISGFGKMDFSNTLISFDTGSVAKVGDVVSSIAGKENDRQIYFYIYYKRPDNKEIEIDKRDFCRQLFQKIVF